MQEILDLERRITAALERIGRAVTLAAPGDAPAAAPRAAVAPENLAPEQLAGALDEERMANAQLTERLRVLHEREAAERQLVVDEMAQIKTAHASEVQDYLAQIAALTREITALQAERRAEAEEITDIVAALNPLIEEARHA